MRRRPLVGLVASILLIATIILTGRLLARRDAVIDLAGHDMATLAPSTRTFLTELDTRIAFTLFVSARRDMPRGMQEVETSVRRLLAAFAERRPDAIDIRIIDPDLGGDAAVRHASLRRASPIDVRRVVDDAESQSAVWSSLVVEYGAHAPVLIQGMRDRDLPGLEGRIVESMRARDHPIRPTFAVIEGPGFELLPALLAEQGEVVRVDLSSGEPFPHDADLLFWMTPRTVTEQHVQELWRFIDSGRSVVLGGAAHELAIRVGADQSIRFRGVANPSWQRLLDELGLRAAPDLLLDTTGGVVMIDRRAPGDDPGGGLERLSAPLFLRCLPGHYNMKSFQGDARGGLSFVAASPLEVLPGRVSAAGFTPEIVATTSDRAAVTHFPQDTFTAGELEPPLPVPKQNLAVLLHPGDAARGQVLVLASASLFRDGVINQEGYAHRVFLSTLVRTFTNQDRLVAIRVPRAAPSPLPDLSGTARLGWRVWVVVAVPLVLIVFAVRRRPSAGFSARRAARAATPLVLAFLLVGLASRAWTHRTGPRLDLTAERVHTPEAATRQRLGRPRGAVRAELVISQRAALPRAWKDIAPRTVDLLSLTDWQVTVTHPEQASDEERAALVTDGVHPVPVSVVADDSLSSGTVWSALRLGWGERRATIPRIDPFSVEHLEFLMAAALDKLESGRAPVVAVVSDVPRLTPAEAYEDYQKQGLVAPRGADVYHQAKTLLVDYGYEVVHVNPKNPKLPGDIDVFLWFQPRRDSSAVIEALAAHLAAGGKAIVAIQHFNIQQRQYRGAGFQTVYWPQPQFPDLAPYLELIGVDQVREVLMDQTRSQLELETQVHRAAHREHDAQQVARPFLIRTVPESYAEAVLTRRLGDLLFIWGNRFAFDDERIAAHDLDTEVLITTSASSWSYAWSGGWIPPESFEPTRFLDGRQPLVTRLRGSFPRVERVTAADGSVSFESAGRGSGDGELLLIGCSEMFKNGAIDLAGFEHRQLLLGAVAGMAHDGELAALQSRSASQRGFSYRPAAEKRVWRAAVVAGGPLLMLAIGVARRRALGRRPS